MEQKISNREIFVLRKKIEILIAGRLRKKRDAEEAISIQNSLSKKSGSWNGEDEITKWRQKR